MKHFMILLVMLSSIACHHSMDSWPSDGDRQDVAMYVRTRSLSGISTLPTTYQFFVYDQSKGTTTRYYVNSESDNNNLLHVKLFPGSYTGYCVTQATAEEDWEYSENSSPDKIYLKSQKTSSGKEEAKDHLLGTSNFEVNEAGGNAIFDLNRKVGMLKITIENIPEWLTDLQINLSKIPQKMSLTGEYSGEYTISKAISIPDENGISTTTILVFPPKSQSNISLSSDAMVFITPEHPITSIQANHITEVKATFHGETTKPEVEIQTKLINWEEETIQEADWEVNIPQGPCTGNGNGYNLVNNNDFEAGLTDNIPTNWKLDSQGESKRAILVNTPVHNGNQAVRLEGKTYLYQDIAVSEGECYQLNMFVNAPNSNVKWRYWYTWMQGSKDLTSARIRSSAFQNQTNGYIDVFENQIFRAPSNANKLRVEIRTYMELTEGEGLYVDDISVEAVNAKP